MALFLGNAFLLKDCKDKSIVTKAKSIRENNFIPQQAFFIVNT
jgi:hypothetical protein